MLGKHLFEPVESLCPEFANLADPGFDLIEAVIAEPVYPSLGIGPGGDDAGISQHFEVLRHGRAAHFKFVCEFTE